MILREYSCSCEACKGMCERTPCLGTPEEMRAIQKAGFGDRLVVINVHHTFMLSPASDQIDRRFNHWPIDGKCKFLTKDGKCELHDLGLKPIEGRTSIHNEGESPDDPYNRLDGQFLRRSLAKSWQRPIGKAIIKQFEREYELNVL